MSKDNSAQAAAPSTPPAVTQNHLPAPMAPMFPDLLANAMPVPVPQMEWQTGLLHDFFHNWKLLRVERATGREASIAENKNRLVKANLSTIKEITTFSASLKDSLEEYDHKSQMRRITLETEKSKLVEQQLKNMLLQGEVKLNEVELKIKLKEMEDLLGTAQT